MSSEPVSKRICLSSDTSEAVAAPTRTVDWVGSEDCASDIPADVFTILIPKLDQATVAQLACAHRLLLAGSGPVWPAMKRLDIKILANETGISRFLVARSNDGCFSGVSDLRFRCTHFASQVPGDSSNTSRRTRYAVIDVITLLAPQLRRAEIEFTYPRHYHLVADNFAAFSSCASRCLEVLTIDARTWAASFMKERCPKLKHLLVTQEPNCITDDIFSRSMPSVETFHFGYKHRLTDRLISQCKDSLPRLRWLSVYDPINHDGLSDETMAFLDSVKTIDMAVPFPLDGLCSQWALRDFPILAQVEIGLHCGSIGRLQAIADSDDQRVLTHHAVPRFCAQLCTNNIWSTARAIILKIRSKSVIGFDAARFLGRLLWTGTETQYNSIYTDIRFWHSFGITFLAEPWIHPESKRRLTPFDPLLLGADPKDAGSTLDWLRRFTKGLEDPIPEPPPAHVPVRIVSRPCPAFSVI